MGLLVHRTQVYTFPQLAVLGEGWSSRKEASSEKFGATVAFILKPYHASY